MFTKSYCQEKKGDFNLLGLSQLDSVSYFSKRSYGFVLLDDSSSKVATTRSLTQYKKSTFLKIHGNIYYDYYYRSNIDTPYQLKGFQQHTIRTFLDVTIKDDYPVRVNFTARINNAGFLKDMAGVNFLFNNQQFADNLKNKLINWLNARQKQSEKLEALNNILVRKQEDLKSLQILINKPSPQQESIKERERIWLAKKNHVPDDSSDKMLNLNPLNTKINLYQYKQPDSLSKHVDSTAEAYSTKFQSNLQKYDSLNKELLELQTKYYHLLDKTSISDKNVINEIKSAHTSNEIVKQVADSGIPDSLLPDGYKGLLAIKSLNIGRAAVNYSELTAKNITINGFQAEYNPSGYYALALGTIDYRYREFILHDPGGEKQYLTIARIGKGQVDGNNIILTWYGGKKQLYNYVTSTNDSVRKPDYQLTGFSVESHYKVGNSTLITAEVAKSASPYYTRVAEEKSLLNSNFSFRDRSNEAYSLKVNSYVPRTGTRLAASYKRIGANFQSFSLFTTSSKQAIWFARIDQPFFKHQLNISASIRTNDFSNPYIDNNYYSSTIFKSIQATLRIKKLPIISLGYSPSSQLTKVSENRYVENLFYTLTGYTSHLYKLKDVRMNTFLSYTRFYNRQMDSGFIYFNTKNIMLSHTLYFKQFSFSVNGTSAMNNEYDLYTTGGELQLHLLKSLSLKGGLKYNYQTSFNNKQVGYNIGTTINIPKLGELQCYVEKGFMPGVNKQLLPNNTGRFSYFKVF